MTFSCMRYTLTALFFLSIRLSTAHEHESMLRQHERHRTLAESPNIKPCGVEDPHTDELLRMQANEAAFANAVLKPARRFRFRILCAIGRRFCSADITIPVYIHNIHAGSSEGRLSKSQISNMVDQANRKLRLGGIRLVVQKINYVRNDDWYYSIIGSAKEIEMQSSLKVGGLDIMNVYLKLPIGSYGELYCGYANLGYYAAEVGVRDGIVVGPKCAEDDKTFPHEVGHYLNLHHTFTGGCHPGDLVDDTPPQSEYVGRIKECPVPFPDSCPNDWGLDPLDNMMDYNPEDCRNIFTKGQYQRMRDAWATFRDPKTRLLAV